MNTEYSYVPKDITVHIDRYRKTIIKEKGDTFYPSGKSKIYPEQIAEWVGKHKRYYGKVYKITNVECFADEGHLFLREISKK